MTTLYPSSDADVITINIAQAKAKLSDLIDEVEAGEDVIITRHGKPVARLSAVGQPTKPIRSLAAFRATLPPRRISSAKTLRQLRDKQR